MFGGERFNTQQGDSFNQDRQEVRSNKDVSAHYQDPMIGRPPGVAHGGGRESILNGLVNLDAQKKKKCLTGVAGHWCGVACRAVYS